MHIPDGFLSPQTCAACWVAATPVWVVAWKNLRRRFEATTAAHVGLGAAFVFLLQMINVPIPGGTTGHAVGAAMVTIALGPAAGIISVSLALMLQAVLFGDGGILAYGANALTMAIIQPLVAWGIWRALAKFKSLAGFMAGYLSAVAGAAVTGLLLGLQPHLFHGPGGAPLYFPLGLKITIPAMVGAHLFIGIIEGGVTLGAVRILARIPGFELASPAPPGSMRRLIAGAAIMIVLAPAGVLLPWIAGSGAPWGEWSPEETAQVAGHAQVPAGMQDYAEKYNAPVPDYQFQETASLGSESIQYAGSALLGVLAVCLACIPIHYLQKRRLAHLERRRAGGAQ